MGMSKYAELYNRVMSYLDDRDWESAYSLVKNGDLQGDADATAILAEFYIHGVGIPEDVETGIELLEKAIAGGCSEAADSLGTLYWSGDKVPCDNRKGISYLMKAAEMGNSRSMGKLANAYFSGRGVPEDYSKALEWGMKAAKLGDINGMEIIAVLYDDGLGVYRDPMQAAHWYRECLQQEPDNTFYMYRLVVCLADPFEDFNLHPDDSMLEEAFTWASKGVEKGDLDCHMMVAWFYETGKVVDQDFSMAYKYFKIAADNGHEMSMELTSAKGIPLSRGAKKRSLALGATLLSAKMDRPVSSSKAMSCTSACSGFDSGTEVAAAGANNEWFLLSPSIRTPPYRFSQSPGETPCCPSWTGHSEASPPDTAPPVPESTAA